MGQFIDDRKLDGEQRDSPLTAHCSLLTLYG
jgi:hypothetical protein